jgi:alkylation response protein AidB-like acyl-CoA dehydrogenase
MIDFTFTEEQEMFRKAAREFAETQVAPHIDEMEKTKWKKQARSAMPS